MAACKPQEPLDAFRESQKESPGHKICCGPTPETASRYPAKTTLNLEPADNPSRQMPAKPSEEANAEPNQYQPNRDGDGHGVPTYDRE
jgi:hypothetical protein